MNPSSTYRLSFRLRAGGQDVHPWIALKDPSTESAPPEPADAYYFSFAIDTPGSWNSYFFEFTGSEVIDAVGVDAALTVGYFSLCPGDVCGDFAYFDDIRLEFVGTVANAPVSWGAMKALFR